jgi:hypothetical protein
MKIGRWPLLLGLSGLLLGGLAPASLLTDALSSQCDGHCRYAEVDGYWWRGSADIYVKTGRSDRDWSRLGQLCWQPEWLGLLLTIGGGSARLAADVTGLQLDIERIRLPAGSLLGRFGHGLPQDGWGGYLTASATHLSMPWNFSKTSGQGEIIWIKARTSLLENHALGDYRLAWSLPNAGRWQGRLSSDKGPMLVDGELALSPFRFVGQARLDPAASPLQKYLMLIGRPEGENRYRISLPKGPDDT